MDSKNQSTKYYRMPIILTLRKLDFKIIGAFTHRITQNIIFLMDINTSAYLSD